MHRTFLREQLGFDAGQAALALSMFGLGAMLAPVAGWFGDVISQKRLIMGTLVLISVASLLMHGTVAGPGGQYVLSLLMGAPASDS